VANGFFGELEDFKDIGDLDPRLFGTSA